MKKILLPLLAISILAFGYTQVDVENANYLATKGIITQQSTTAGYRLDDTITRAEVAGIALKLRGTILPEGYTCKRYFGDTIRNDWICRAVELAADAGLVSRTNTTFRPQDKITRAEALAIIMKAGGVKNEPESDFLTSLQGYRFIDSNDWQSKLIFSAFIKEIVIPTKKEINCDIGGPCFEVTWQPNNNATRAEIFAFAKNILEYQATMSGEVMIDMKDQSIRK